MNNTLKQFYYALYCALFILAVDDQLASVKVRNCSFWGNPNGIVNNNGTYTVENCIFACNHVGVCYGNISKKNNIVWNQLQRNEITGNFQADIVGNPLMVNRSKNGFEMCEDHSPDGFYLAQGGNIDGNVSHLPLVIRDLLLGSDPSTIQPDSGIPTSICVEVYGSWEPGGGREGKGKLEQGLYSDWGEQYDLEMPLLIQLNGTTGQTVDTEDRIILNLINGDTVEVFLPAIDFSQGSEVKLWVAEDGSTYYARSDHGFGGGITQSARYAMLYDLDASGEPVGLAQGAFEARAGRPDYPNANSPAVDAGSDDAWGYDSTSTNPEVIDMSQPDIGYHYYRRIADDDPVDSLEVDQEITFTFRQPAQGDVPIDGYRISKKWEVTGDVDIGLPILISDPEAKGKEVVTHTLINELLDKTTYDLKVRSYNQPVGQSENASERATIKVIVDPEAPVIE